MLLCRNITVTQRCKLIYSTGALIWYWVPLRVPPEGPTEEHFVLDEIYLFICFVLFYLFEYRALQHLISEKNNWTLFSRPCNGTRKSLQDRRLGTFPSVSVKKQKTNLFSWERREKKRLKENWLFRRSLYFLHIHCSAVKLFFFGYPSLLAVWIQYAGSGMIRCSWSREGQGWQFGRAGV